MQMIVTPKVRAEVQSHFNCPELEGAELEDQGEDGTALTHWEKRVFEVSIVKYKLKGSTYWGRIKNEEIIEFVNSVTI